MPPMTTLLKEARLKDRAEAPSHRILENIPKAHARSDAHTILNWLRSGVLRRRHGGVCDRACHHEYHPFPRTFFGPSSPPRRASACRSLQSLSPPSVPSSTSRRTSSSSSACAYSSDEASDNSDLYLSRSSLLRPSKSRSFGPSNKNRKPSSKITGPHSAWPPRPNVFTCPCCDNYKRGSSISCPNAPGSENHSDFFAEQTTIRRPGARRVFQKSREGGSLPHFDGTRAPRSARRLHHCSSNPQLGPLSTPPSSAGIVSRHRRGEGSTASLRISSWSLTGDDEPPLSRSRLSSSLFTSLHADGSSTQHFHYPHLLKTHTPRAPRPSGSIIESDERSIEILEDREQAAMKMKMLNGLSCQKSLGGDKLGDSEMMMHLVQLNLLD